MTPLFTVEDALWIYTVGTGLDPVIRDLGALASSLDRPWSQFNSNEFYPTLTEKAAVLLESINRNHPLADGNKRLSWLLVRALYGAYNIHPKQIPPPIEVDLFIRGVASRSVSLDEIIRWMSEVFPTAEL